jgi:hypothetical protein
MYRTILATFVLAVPTVLFAQAGDSPYQVNYASNLNLGDGVVNVTNDGASATAPPIVNGNSYGDICVNAYVYAPDQELAACCSCLVSPNSIHAWPVIFGSGALLANVNNTTVANSIATTHSVVIKLLATQAVGIPSLNVSCNRPDTPGTLVAGMIAWGTHSHPTNTPSVAITETPFVNGTLSAGELSKLTGDCNNLLTRGSGSVCPGCITGGLALNTTL